MTAAPQPYTNINSTSPLKHDYPILDGWRRMARRDQAPGRMNPSTG
ncbi:hypothetical protein PSM7751_00024 [Pseudooceanicola marinus]|uniref:Uncharacterized protein n=1 Tax=Pseudooceanicola marinus TaxID=396013 RepID=A0A1X6Y3G0_9RHOB|nr:hypothetical protein PSM7751_00024 [Pseudooceanicola marinus]